PGGEVGPAAALDEPDQRMQVVPRVGGDLGRERAREAALGQLLPAPPDYLVDRCVRCCFRLHTFLVPSHAPVLTSRPPRGWGLGAERAGTCPALVEARCELLD